jgi:hypothetical protein
MFVWENFTDEKKSAVAVGGIATLAFLLAAAGIWGTSGFLICLFIVAIVIMIGAFVVFVD